MTILGILDSKGSHVETVSQDTTARVAASTMSSRGIAALVVMDDTTIVGLFTEREVLEVFSRSGDELKNKKVGEVMRRGVVTVAPSDSITRAMGLMTQHRTRHLPVQEDGLLVGIVSIGDLVRYRLEDLETEARVLRDIYIAGR